MNLNLDFLFEEVKKDVTEKKEETDGRKNFSDKIESLVKSHAPKILKQLYKDIGAKVLKNLKNKKAAPQPEAEKPDELRKKLAASAGREAERKPERAEERPVAKAVSESFLFETTAIDKSPIMTYITNNISKRAIQKKIDLEKISDRLEAPEAALFLNEIRLAVADYFKTLGPEEEPFKEEQKTAWNNMLFGKAKDYYEDFIKEVWSEFLKGSRGKEREKKLGEVKSYATELFLNLLFKGSESTILSPEKIRLFIQKMYKIFREMTRSGIYHARSDIGKFDINILTLSLVKGFFSHASGNPTSSDFPDIKVPTQRGWLSHKFLPLGEKHYTVRNPLNGASDILGKSRTKEIYIEVKSGIRRPPRRSMNDFISEFKIKVRRKPYPYERSTVADTIKRQRDERLKNLASEYKDGKIPLWAKKEIEDAYREALRSANLNISPRTPKEIYDKKTSDIKDEKISRRAGDISQQNLWNALGGDAKEPEFRKKFLTFFNYLHPLNINDDIPRIYYLELTPEGFNLKRLNERFIKKGKLFISGGVIYYGLNEKTPWLKLKQEKSGMSYLELFPGAEDSIIEILKGKGGKLAITKDEARVYEAYLDSKGEGIKKQKEDIKEYGDAEKKEKRREARKEKNKKKK
jgi:hypothetical protein